MSRLLAADRSVKSTNVQRAAIDLSQAEQIGAQSTADAQAHGEASVRKANKNLRGAQRKQRAAQREARLRLERLSIEAKKDNVAANLKATELQAAAGRGIVIANSAVEAARDAAASEQRRLAKAVTLAKKAAGAHPTTESQMALTSA